MERIKGMVGKHEGYRVTVWLIWTFCFLEEQRKRSKSKKLVCGNQEFCLRVFFILSLLRTHEGEKGKFPSLFLRKQLKASFSINAFSVAQLYFTRDFSRGSRVFLQDTPANNSSKFKNFKKKEIIMKKKVFHLSTLFHLRALQVELLFSLREAKFFLMSLNRCN